MSRDVVFDKSTSWYSILVPIPDDFVSITEDVASEADMNLEAEEINTQEESLISFRLSGLNEELARDGQPTDMPVSNNDLAVPSP